MTDGASIKEAAAINGKTISTLLIIYRVAHRALSAEERVGQQIQRNARAEIEGLIIQMMAIEKLAHAALPKVGREADTCDGVDRARRGSGHASRSPANSDRSSAYLIAAS